MREAMWAVWSECGEYDQYQRTLEGLFEDRALAEGFRQRVAGAEEKCERIPILTEAPCQVTLYTWAAHVWPDGLEDTDLGFQRSSRQVWQHQHPPVEEYFSKWHGVHRPNRDLYIKVTGWDLEAVESRYAALLAEAGVGALDA